MSFELSWLEYIINPLFCIIFGEIYRVWYDSLSRYHIPFKEQTVTRRKIFPSFEYFRQPMKRSELINQSSLIFFPILIFISSILLTILLPLSPNTVGYQFSTSLEFIFLIFILINLFQILLTLSSRHIYRIQATKEISAKIIRYFLPMIIAILGLYVSLYRQGILDISFASIVAIQNEQIDLIGLEVPAIFFFTNPWIFLTFLTAIIGMNRETTLDALTNEPLRNWDPINEFTGWSRGLIELSKSILLFVLVALMFPLFFGSMWSDFYAINLEFIIFWEFIIISLIAILSRGKPRTVLDRKIQHFIRTPFLLALISLVWAIFI